MSDNEVIVTIEPELLDFETTHKAPGDVGNSKPSRLPPRLISPQKIRLPQLSTASACCHD
jgi:hypothetical protein